MAEDDFCVSSPEKKLTKTKKKMKKKTFKNKFVWGCVTAKANDDDCMCQTVCIIVCQ